MADYKRQFERAFRRPGDDPSVFAIELETLAWRAFVDIDSSEQLVRDRFIDGQAECALRRHLDSLGPDTPMRDIMDSCRVWESHVEVASSRQVHPDRHSPRAVCQVTEDSQSPAVSSGSETLEEIIRRLLPKPTVPPPKAVPIPQPVIQEQSKLTDMEIVSQNLPPVGSVTAGDVPSSKPLPESLKGCFSCGVWTHTTDQSQTLDESFPFLPTGWQSGPHWGRVPFETGPRRALKPTDGQCRLIRGEGLVARISNDYEPQLPVVGEDITGPAVTNCLETVRSLETVDQRVTMVGHGFQLPCSDSEESDDDVLSVGPARPLVTAALLGGTENYWTADDLYGSWMILIV